MKLVNLTKKTTLSYDLKEASSFIDRSLGLLRSSNPRSLLFRTRFGVHTFGLTEQVDIVVLDNNMRVAKLLKGLKPNRLFFWNPLFDTVIETTEGTIKRSKTEIGDSLKLV